LAKRGWRLFATVRKESDRESLLKEWGEHRELKEIGELAVLLCDVTKEAQVAELGRVVAAKTSALDALVNNAGTAFASPLELIPISELRKQFEINVFAQLAVTQSVLPLIKAAKGTIVNVSSISGRMTNPMSGPYSASKFALEALSDALRVELAHFGVKVVVIEPGSSPTAIWQTGKERALGAVAERGLDTGAYQPLIDAALKYMARVEATGFPPQLFADTVEKILNSPHPRARYAIPARVRWLILLRRLAPDWAWDRLLRRVLRW
ncbi:MAG: SDR family NAD(P)-dependent oxidoreductase, partial [Chloroflexota bacterium]